MLLSGFTVGGATIDFSSFLASLQYKVDQRVHCTRNNCHYAGAHKVYYNYLLKVPAVLRKAVVSKYRNTSAADSAELTLLMGFLFGLTVCSTVDILT